MNTGKAAGVAANEGKGIVCCFRSEGVGIAIVVWRTARNRKERQTSLTLRGFGSPGSLPVIVVGGYDEGVQGTGTALSSMIDSPSGIRVRVRVRDVDVV